MSSISTIFLPEDINQVSIERIKSNLDLVESIVGFSKAKRLTREDIERITKKLGSRMSGSRLYPGGSSVLFGWSFNYESIGPIIIKPYYTRELPALFIHYFTLQDLEHYFDDIQVRFQSLRISIEIPRVIGFAKIKTITRYYPVLLTLEVLGEPIHKISGLIALTSKIARKLGKKGIIMDPYPSNWKFAVKNGELIISYIDLLSSNTLKNLKKRMSVFIKDFNKTI